MYAEGPVCWTVKPIHHQQFHEKTMWLQLRRFSRYWSFWSIQQFIASRHRVILPADVYSENNLYPCPFFSCMVVICRAVCSISRLHARIKDCVSTESVLIHYAAKRDTVHLNWTQTVSELTEKKTCPSHHELVFPSADTSGLFYPADLWDHLWERINC